MDDLKFDEAGLIAAVAQDRLTGQVRMVAWMNREAVAATLTSGFATFYSRSRGRLWRKGETSGNQLVVREFLADCDGDTLLLLVDPAGPSCHTGRQSCLFRDVRVDDESQALKVGPERTFDGAPLLTYLEEELAERACGSADKSYTKYLLDRGVPKINEKIAEEASELCQALAEESDDRVANEAGDLIYHLMVGLRARGVSLRSVIEVLAARRGRSGHEEKASRGG